MLHASFVFGLPGAANGRGLLNPMVVVQGQIFQIVQGGPTVTDMLHGWTVVGHENSVMYPGSLSLYCNIWVWISQHWGYSFLVSFE